MEIVWSSSSNKLTENKVIIEFLTCLSNEESRCFIDTLEALYLTSELTHICQILLRLEEILLAVNVINWPDDINLELSLLLSALSKIKSQKCFKIRLEKETLSTKNPIYGRIEEYPIAALFCQQFGHNIQENQKPLLFLLNFMLFQIARHNKWEPKKKDALLTNAANTLRKIIACDIKFDRNFPLSKLTFEKLNRLLIVLTSGKHINFQEQFLIAWSQFYRDQLFVRKQVKKDNYQTKKPLSHKRLNLLPTNITETGNGTAINRGFISILPNNNTDDDIDNAIVDIIEVDNVNNVELDHRTKHAASIYGSRLSLIEKKHLPWRSNVLAKHEVTELVAYIKSAIVDPSDLTAIFACLVLLTSKPYSELLQVKIFVNTPPLSNTNHDFIDLSSGTWWRRSIEMPNAYVPSSEQKHLLSEHSDWLMLPLPKELMVAFKNLDIRAPLTIKQLCFKEGECTIEAKLSAFLKTLWKNNPLLYRRITPAAVRATLFERITQQFDSGYAALMLANTEFDTPTTLYYLSEKATKLKADYVDLVAQMGFQIIDQSTKKECVVGSRLAMNKAEISKIIKAKRAALLALIREPSPSLEHIIFRHNQFVNYTLLVLVAATGHRSRTEFGFSTYSSDDTTQLTLIADKMNFVDSAVRFIPQCSIVQKQIVAYKNHCADISRLIKPHNLALATALSKASTQQLNDKPTFFHIKNHSITSIGKNELTEYLQPEINLPLNFLRHYFCSSLRSLGKYQYAKTMMGHVGSGEHLLSDHACSSLDTIKTLADTIDVALKDIGIDAIEFTPPKGPKIDVSAENIRKPYSPSYLKRNEVTERSEQIRWVRKLVSPHVKALLNPKTHEQTADELLKQAIADDESTISVERRLFWLNRIITKISRSRRWISALNEPEILTVETDILLKTRQSQLIKSKINNWLFSNNHPLTHTEQVAKIWCSLVINSALDSPISLPNINLIKAPPFYEHGMAWFEITNGNNSSSPKVLYIDSISLLLIQKYTISNIKIKSAAEIKKCIYQNVLHAISKINQLDHQAKQALKSIDSTGEYLRNARDVSTLSLLHAYQNNRLLTTDLDPEKICRWLSANSVVFKPPIAESNLLTPFSTLVLDHTVNSNFESSLIFIRKLQQKLTLLKKVNTNKKQVSKAIIQTWADFINLPNETHIENLIQHSKHLNEMMILIVLWLIDVAKRPGRQKRKCTAVGTVKTYLSNIGKPLLEQSIGRSILAMESEELTELYSDALDARNVHDRAQRAENMRNFHNFVMNSFQCSPVDWHIIEPSINNHKRVADANIMSMREYNTALSLLKNDPYMRKNERNINQIILILCYRAGLRSGEATHLKINDIDSCNWIIHIRTNALHRAKTLKSNRRIPVSLLLSEEEKQLIIKQIELVKQYHPNEDELWLFSDKASSYCLVQLEKHTSRVSEAIKTASGDNSLRLHHARHSFANYLLLLMTKLYYTANIYAELKSWSRTDNIDEFSQLMAEMLTGKQTPQENILHAISLTMGHASPETTLRSYVHILSIMSAAEHEKKLVKNIAIPAIASLADIKKNHVYKILERGNTELYGFIPLCDYIAKQWLGYQQLARCRQQNNVQLNAINPNNEHRIYIELNTIERIIRAAEKGNLITHIAQRLQLDYLFVQDVVKATQYIKLETGYLGTSINSDLAYILFTHNKNKQQTTTKYIKQAEFQKILADLAKLTKSHKIALSKLWQKNYTPKHGVVIDAASFVKFKALLAFIDYHVIEANSELLVRDKYGKRKGKIIKFVSKKRNNTKNNDNKLHHAIFLLSVWLIAKKQITNHEGVVHEH